MLKHTDQIDIASLFWKTGFTEAGEGWWRLNQDEIVWDSWENGNGRERFEVSYAWQPATWSEKHLLQKRREQSNISNVSQIWSTWIYYNALCTNTGIFSNCLESFQSAAVFEFAWHYKTLHCYTIHCNSFWSPIWLFAFIIFVSNNHLGMLSQNINISSNHCFGCVNCRQKVMKKFAFTILVSNNHHLKLQNKRSAPNVSSLCVRRELQTSSQLTKIWLSSTDGDTDIHAFLR